MLTLLVLALVLGTAPVHYSRHMNAFKAAFLGLACLLSCLIGVPLFTGSSHQAWLVAHLELQHARNPVWQLPAAMLPPVLCWRPCPCCGRLVPVCPVCVMYVWVALYCMVVWVASRPVAAAGVISASPLGMSQCSSVAVDAPSTV